MGIPMELDIQMGCLLHHQPILTFLKLHVILLFLLLNLLRLKLSKLKGLICQMTRVSLTRLNSVGHKRLRHKPKGLNLDMLTCTLDTILLSMLHNHLTILNAIFNVCLILFPMAHKTFRKPIQPQHKSHVSHTRQL